MTNNRQPTTDNRHGQSLIEAIIAISLLTVGFLGIAALLSQSLFLTKVVSDQTKATYLAAEGIELAKNLIDHDVYMHLAGLGTGWGTCFGNGRKNWEIDYTTVNCGAMRGYSADDVLYFSSSTGLYSYNPSGAPTKFTREIKTFSPPGQPDITVNSIVTWSTGAFTSQRVNLEDHFYNWRP